MLKQLYRIQSKISGTIRDQGKSYIDWNQNPSQPVTNLDHFYKSYILASRFMLIVD